ncbi:MAG: hypothetical protein WCL44_00500 [bacterium]
MRPKAVHRGGQRSGGSVLIVSLWTVLLLGLMAAALCAHVSNRAAAAWDVANRAVCYRAARAGVAAAVAEVRHGTNAESGALSAWNNNPAGMKDIPVGGGVFTVHHTVGDAGGVVHTNYGVADECGRININGITNEVTCWLVTSLLRDAACLSDQDAEKLAASIADWIDEDGQARDGGSEVGPNTALDGAYAVHNGRITILEELLLVRGMDTNIFSAIADHLTIHGTNTGVNLNTADYAVLRALALARNGAQDADAEGLVKRIVEFRDAGNVLQTLDKRAIRKQLFGEGEMSASQRGQWTILEWLLNHHLIAVQAGYFCGISTGRLPDGAAVERRIAFVFDGTTGEMKAWHEE